MCCPTDYADYTSTIFMGRCLRGLYTCFIIYVHHYHGIRPYNHPIHTATLSLQPIYCGSNFNMATLLIWSDFCGPLATGLTEFHCNWLFLKYLYLIFVPLRDGNEFDLLPTKQNSLLHILGVNYLIYKKHQLSI